MKRFNFLVILLVVLVIPVFGQKVEGIIHDPDHKPMPGATIHLHELERYTTTNLEGRFIFSNVPKGSYHVDVTSVGFEPVSVEVKVPQLFPIEIHLHQSTVEIKEVVIEESMISSLNRNRARSIEVVDEQSLTVSGASSLVEALAEKPGVQMIKIGTGTAKPIIRGLGFNRVMTNLNGIKQEGQQWGADHGLAVDQNSIQRAEIIKGANSLIYGSDALGGVLNLQQFSLLPKEGFHAKVGFRGQSVSMRANPFAKISLKKGDFFSVFSGSYAASGDIAVPAQTFNYNSFVYPIFNERLKNTASNEYAYSGMFGLQKKWGQIRFSGSAFSQQVGFFPGAHGRPDFDLLFEDGNRFDLNLPHQQIDHLNLVSEADFFLPNGWLEIDVGFQQNERTEWEEPHQHKPGPSPITNMALSLNLNTTSANARFHHTVQSGKAVSGLSLQHKENIEDGFEYFLPNFSATSIGAFFYREKPLSEKLTLNYGLRGDVKWLEVNPKSLPVYADDNSYLTDTLITPAASNQFSNATGAVGWVFRPNHFKTWKLNIGSGFRFPTVPELTANGFHHGSFRYEIGNASLETERMFSIDGSFDWHNNNMTFTISPYVNYFLGYIFSAPSGKFASKYFGGGQIHSYEQANAIHAGLEFNADFHLTDPLHIGFNGAYVIGHNTETNRPLPFMPPFTMQTKLSYEWNDFLGVHFEPFITGRLFAAQNRVAINELKTPGAFILSSGFSAHWPNKLSAGVSIQNLLNTSYVYHLSRFRLLNLPEPGRNVTLSISYYF